MLPFVGIIGQNRYDFFLISIGLLLIIRQTFHPPHRQFWEGEVFKTSKPHMIKKVVFTLTLIQVTLPTTRLKISSKRSHVNSQPVTSADVLAILSGTQVGRSMSVIPDTTIEIASL